jgi:hypothetical protein
LLFETGSEAQEEEKNINRNNLMKNAEIDRSLPNLNTGNFIKRNQICMDVKLNGN